MPAHLESIPGLIAITAQSDLIATVPKSLLAPGIADRLLEPLRVREKMAASTMSLFIKRDSPLHPAAGRLVRLIKGEASACALRDRVERGLTSKRRR
jgi:DNA-binding transcriptional LysR family regulator